MNTVVRWNPFREIAAMQNAMRAVENNWRDARPQWTGRALPLDVHENDDAYSVIAELPGLSVDQINVQLHEGVLTVSAEVAPPEVDENTRVLAQERAYGNFSRSIRLPQHVDVNAVEADYQDGVLTLTLPKAPEAKPRQITVNVGSKILQS